MAIPNDNEASSTLAGGRHPYVDAIFGQLPDPTLRGGARIALLTGLVVVGTFIVLLRTPRSMWNLLWAEDGAVFLSDALQKGPEAVVAGYAGYLHLVPRAAMEVAILFPLPIVPVIVTVLSASIVSLLACACFVFLESRVVSVPLRFACWLVCLVLPTMGGDVTNNLANLHWFLLIAAFCAVTCRARTLPIAIVEAAVVFAAVASDALALLLIPFFAARWWLGPSRRDRAVVLAYAAGAVLQLITVGMGLLGTGPARQIAHEYPALAQFLDLYAYRVVLVGAFGMRGASGVSSLLGSVVPGLALALVMLVIVATTRRDRYRRVAVLLFAGSSVVFAAVIYSLQWYAIHLTPVDEVLVGLRYAVVPSALLLLALLQAADGLLGRLGNRRALISGVVILVAVSVPAAVDYRATIGRDAPSWRDAIALGLTECEDGKADANGNVVIPTPPLPFGGMLIPCEALANLQP